MVSTNVKWLKWIVIRPKPAFTIVALLLFLLAAYFALAEAHRIENFASSSPQSFLTTVTERWAIVLFFLGVMAFTAFAPLIPMMVLTVVCSIVVTEVISDALTGRIVADDTIRFITPVSIAVLVLWAGLILRIIQGPEKAGRPARMK